MKTRIGVVGCGFVFDKYMETVGRHPRLEITAVSDTRPERLAAVKACYGVTTRETAAELYADDRIDVIANFTPIHSHYDVTCAALNAGKHVYSEKPLATDLAQARELFRLARKKNVVLSCAPSNLLSATVQTIWKAVLDGAIGRTRVVSAEFDTTPLYLQSGIATTPQNPNDFPYLVESRPTTRSGAVFPWAHEFEMGCTYEHAGYHLSWMCAVFGPVKNATAFSKQVMPDKFPKPLNPNDTPDYSVVSLNFDSGVVGRLTCSIAGPHDNRIRVVGDKGFLHAFTYNDYQCPVYLEAFSRLTNKARYVRGLEVSRTLGALLGVGGRRLPLVRSESTRHKTTWLNILQKRKLRSTVLGGQDKCLGLLDLGDAVACGRPPLLSEDFILHVTELTLFMQGAGELGASKTFETTFTPLRLPESTKNFRCNYKDYTALPVLGRLANKFS
jgi:predicted dehydrogenase